MSKQQHTPRHSPENIRYLADTIQASHPVEAQVVRELAEWIERDVRQLAEQNKELLEALECLLSEFGKQDHLTDYSAATKARAAIAKAKGETK